MRFEPKIYVKGLILVAVPLILTVAFGVSLLNLLSVYRNALDQEARAKEIIYHANEMWLWCTDAITSKFEARILPDAWKTFGPELEHLETEYAVLSELVKDDPEQTRRLQKIKRHVDALIRLADRFETPRMQAGSSQVAVLTGKYMAFRQLQRGIKRLRIHIMDFRTPVLRQTQGLSQRARQLHYTIEQLTVISVVGSLLLASGLYIYFMKGINSGIQVLLNNTKRLAGSENLLPVLNTTDELGQLDRSFHEMADALDKRSSELERVNRELSRSNSDLQQFAYVTSHDLQEPLRAVSGYLDIFMRQYSSALETKAESLVQKARDGAKRMETLIRDLLAYTRVDSHIEFAPVDCGKLLEESLANLAAAVEESGAVVTKEQLPMVRGERSQLMLLFQNLIGNAIKFRRDEVPQVNVTARKVDSEWEFWVRDNGIGIDMAQAEQVFTIFRRLHTRGKYPGTGIGLAICKKIVEGHGGKIWIESEPGVGTTFKFTLPAAVDNAEPEKTT